ncbi:hypothetical protein LTR27_003451 [Elasticomyces elasticus]|nr:hypothetical protein LTR27_003451 [Elasticomyces elasticus]
MAHDSPFERQRGHIHDTDIERNAKPHLGTSHHRLPTDVQPPNPGSKAPLANQTTPRILDKLSTQLLQLLLAREFDHPLIHQYFSPGMQSVWHFFGRVYGLQGFLNNCDICFALNSRFKFTLFNSCAMAKEDKPTATVWVTLRISNLPSYDEADLVQETVVKLDWQLEAKTSWLCYRVTMIRGGPAFAGI